MLKVIKRSLVKGLRDTGIAIGTAAATAGLIAAQDPEVLAPLAAALGPYGAIALFVVPLVAKTGLDALKHRGKAGAEE